MKKREKLKDQERDKGNKVEGGIWVKKGKKGRGAR